MGAGQQLDILLEGLRAEDLDLLCAQELASTLIDLRQRIDWLEAEWALRGSVRSGQWPPARRARFDDRFLEAPLPDGGRTGPASGHAWAAAHGDPTHREGLLQRRGLLGPGPAVDRDSRASGFRPGRDEVSLVNGLAGLAVANRRRLLDYWQTAGGPAVSFLRPWLGR